MSLNVGVICTEELAGSVDCQLFNLINEFASAVVSLARIPFSVLVCQRASCSFHDFVINEVLGSYHFNLCFLTVDLPLN